MEEKHQSEYEYFEKQRKNFEKANKISFSKREEAIEFIAKYFTNFYEEDLRLWREVLKGENPKEQEKWEKEFESEIRKVYEAIKKALIDEISDGQNFSFFKKVIKKKIIIDRLDNAKIYEEALRVVNNMTAMTIFPEKAYCLKIDNKYTFSKK